MTTPEGSLVLPAIDVNQDTDLITESRAIDDLGKTDRKELLRARNASLGYGSIPTGMHVQLNLLETQ